MPGSSKKPRCAGCAARAARIRETMDRIARRLNGHKNPDKSIKEARPSK